MAILEKIQIIILLVSFPLLSFSQQRTCSYFILGRTAWMTVNLDATHFSNGDPIKQATNKFQWIKYYAKKEPAWCYFNFDANTKDNVGVLYNIYAIKDKRGLAPKGWEIPDSDDWSTLNKFITFRGDDFLSDWIELPYNISDSRKQDPFHDIIKFKCQKPWCNYSHYEQPLVTWASKKMIHSDYSSSPNFNIETVSLPFNSYWNNSYEDKCQKDKYSAIFVKCVKYNMISDSLPNRLTASLTANSKINIGISEYLNTLILKFFRCIGEGSEWDEECIDKYISYPLITCFSEYISQHPKYAKNLLDYKKALQSGNTTDQRNLILKYLRKNNKGVSIFHPTFSKVLNKGKDYIIV